MHSYRNRWPTQRSDRGKVLIELAKEFRSGSMDPSGEEIDAYAEIMAKATVFQAEINDNVRDSSERIAAGLMPVSNTTINEAKASTQFNVPLQSTPSTPPSKQETTVEQKGSYFKRIPNTNDYAAIFRSSLDGTASRERLYFKQIPGTSEYWAIVKISVDGTPRDLDILLNEIRSDFVKQNANLIGADRTFGSYVPSE